MSDSLKLTLVVFAVAWGLTIAKFVLDTTINWITDRIISRPYKVGCWYEFTPTNPFAAHRKVTKLVVDIEDGWVLFQDKLLPDEEDWQSFKGTRYLKKYVREVDG